jgi:hypothetical protein
MIVDWQRFLGPAERPAPLPARFLRRALQIHVAYLVMDRVQDVLSQKL